MQRDPWHVGQLPGDNGRVIRDQNGLFVAAAHTVADALRSVQQHNAGEFRARRVRHPTA
ncbi:hypothetical protein V7S57_02575 [Caulobacter sp. CCNWLY153]|uniref:hypothetical protein n=1 Tax=unclassified Caulobacter TaxID=2648921 RepID=UPI002FF3CD2B